MRMPVGGWFRANERPKNLTETFANFTVVNGSDKIMEDLISMFIVAGAVFNGMIYIGGTPALDLGAKGAKFGPQFG